MDSKVDAGFHFGAEGEIADGSSRADSDQQSAAHLNMEIFRSEIYSNNGLAAVVQLYPEYSVSQSSQRMLYKTRQMNLKQRVFTFV